MSSNGLSERLNQTFSKMLSHFVNDDHDNWDEQLSQVAFAYNTSVQESSKRSPFVMVYGREVRFPFEYPGNNDDLTKEKKDIFELRESVRLILQREQQRYKEREDLNRKPFSYNINDYVKLRYPKKCKANQSMKFIPFYKGKYKIIENINDLVYRVKCESTGREI